jgi:WD40 repeat protein
MPSLKATLWMLVLLTATPVAWAAKPAPRRELDGQPLPSGVLARLGSARLRPGAVVTHMAVSPDGRLLATTYLFNDHCDLWDTATGKLVRRIELHLTGGNEDTKFAFTNRGATLVVLTADKTITAHWFDVATGKERRHLDVRPYRGHAQVAVSPGGDLAAVAMMDRSVHIYSLTNGIERCRWHVAGRLALGLGFSSDGRRLAVGDFSNTVQIRDTLTGRKIFALMKDRFPISGFAYASHSPCLVTRSFDRNSEDENEAVSVWDLTTGRERCRLNASWYGLALAVSPDGKTVSVGGPDKDLVLFDATTGKELHRLRTWPMSMQAVFFPDGKTLAVAGNSGTITLWNVKTGTLLPTSPDPITKVKAISFSADGKQVVGRAERLIAWDAATGRVLHRFPEASDTPLLYALSPNGLLHAMAGQENKHAVISLLDARTGRKLRTLGSQEIAALRFTPDSRELVSGDSDRKVRVWDVATGKTVYVLEGHNDPVDLLSIAPNGRWLATASTRARGDADVRLWDLTSGREVRRFHPRLGSASAVALSSDGHYLAVAGFHFPSSSEVQIWETTTGKVWRVLPGPKQIISCISWSPDDRMLAFGDEAREYMHDDHTVRLWELSTGLERRRITDQHGISSVAFSPNGKRLAVASSDAPVLVYDLMYIKGGARLTDAALQASWTALADQDAAKAWKSMLQLIAEPAKAVRFLGTHLRPVQTPDIKAIHRLIANLDSRRFAARAKANAELEKLGRLAEPALRKALAGSPSAEVRTRVERLLQDLEKPTADELRGLRAIEVLERIGTAPARQVLSALAKGVPQATVTMAARGALDRHSARPPASAPR